MPSGLQTPTAGTSALEAGTQAGPSVMAICAVWKDIEFDRLKDTLETISEVKQQNLARDTYCAGL